MMYVDFIVEYYALDGGYLYRVIPVGTTVPVLGQLAIRPDFVFIGRFKPGIFLPIDYPIRTEEGRFASVMQLKQYYE